MKATSRSKFEQKHAQQSAIGNAKNQRFAGQRSSSPAFNLIELLVTMSVIGILASLLIPAVRSAKCKADSARCISNLRQLGIAVRHYADENEGRLPRAIEFAQARINGAGTLRVTRDPNRPDFKLPELTLPADIPYERLLHHRSMQKLIDQQSRLLSHSAQARGMDAYYERALAMLESPKLRQAFDLAAEHQDPVRPEDLAATIYYLLGIDPHTEI